MRTGAALVVLAVLGGVAWWFLCGPGGLPPFAELAARIDREVTAAISLRVGESLDEEGRPLSIAARRVGDAEVWIEVRQRRSPTLTGTTEIRLALRRGEAPRARARVRVDGTGCFRTSWSEVRGSLRVTSDGLFLLDPAPSDAEWILAWDLEAMASGSEVRTDVSIVLRRADLD